MMPQSSTMPAKAGPPAVAAPQVSFGGRVRRMIFGVKPIETDLDRRGFRVDDADVRERLGHVIDSFLAGYHGALEDSDPTAIANRLAALDPELCGFAFEGAGMGLAILDGLPFGGNRLQRFLAGPGDAHEYMVWVGVGWGIARLPGGYKRKFAKIAPMRRYLAVDGLGFHDTFFHEDRAVVAQAIPDGLDGYARRAWDQGVGRCLWFIDGAGPERVAKQIARFAAARHSDLWAGVGLACTYAGGVERHVLESVVAASGEYVAHLAQGSAFAALARGRAGNPSPRCELACDVIWQRSAQDVYALAREAEQGIPLDDEEGYERLRTRIRNRFEKEMG